MKRFISAALIFIIAALTVISVSASGTTVSEGKEYSLVTSASNSYPDDGTKLTDGVFGTVPDGSSNYYSSNAYVGFDKEDLGDESSFAVILDLGKSYAMLTEFTVGYLNEPEAGIVAPKNVSFAISGERNGEYTDLGTLNTSKTDSDASASTYADTLTSENASGRYVRVTIVPSDDSDSGWTFIDEISVRTPVEIDESSAEETSDVTESSVESETASESSEDISIPQTGDDGFTNLSLILLAIAAFGITAALFIRTRNLEEY